MKNEIFFRVLIFLLNISITLHITFADVTHLARGKLLRATEKQTKY
jgi:hypothetical protein